MRPEIPLQRMDRDDAIPGPWLGPRRHGSVVSHAPELVGIVLGMVITVLLAVCTMVMLSQRDDRDALPKSERQEGR